MGGSGINRRLKSSRDAVTGTAGADASSGLLVPEMLFE